MILVGEGRDPCPVEPSNMWVTASATPSKYKEYELEEPAGTLGD